MLSIIRERPAGFAVTYVGQRVGRILLSAAFDIDVDREVRRCLTLARVLAQG